MKNVLLGLFALLLFAQCQTSRKSPSRVVVALNRYVPIEEDRVFSNVEMTFFEKIIEEENTPGLKYRYKYIDPFTLDTVAIPKLFYYPLDQIWVNGDRITMIFRTNLQLSARLSIHCLDKRNLADSEVYEGFPFFAFNKRERLYHDSNRQYLFFVSDPVSANLTGNVVALNAHTHQLQVLGSTILGLLAEGGINNYLEIDEQVKQIVVDGRERFSYAE